MNRRVSLILIIILVSPLFATGCWSRIELEQHAITAGVGVDFAEDKNSINLTLQVILPGKVKAPTGGGGQGGGDEAVWRITSTGRSVFDALRRSSLQTGKKATNAHSRILIIGEEVARTGIEDVIDFYERDHEVRRRMWVLIAKGEAREILETKFRAEKIPAYGISNLVKGSKLSSKVVAVDLNKFLGLISSKTTCAYASGVEVFEKKGEEEKTGDKAAKETRVKLTETAVFKDYKLKGWLNQAEARGLLWVLGEVGGGIIDVESLTGKGTTSLQIRRMRSKVKPEINNGKVTITVEVYEEGQVGATPIPSADLSQPKTLKELEISKSKVIEREIRAVVKKAQEYNTDIFGFGEAVYRKYPKEWKQLEKEWDKLFPELEVQTKVETRLRHTGLITKPAAKQ